MANLPTYFMRIVPDDPEFKERIVDQIPGVYTVKRSGDWRGALRVPYNAGWLVQEKAEAAGYRVQMLKAPPDYVRPTWSQVSARLLEQGFREAYLGAFPTSYQKIGVCFTAELPGGHLWWPGGCLTGDIVLTVNRAGRGFKIRLDELVARFNRSHGKWDPAIVTQAQSRTEDGFVRLNPIVRAYATGNKPVFRLQTASGKTIKATEDHRFYTESGWTPLRNLRVGGTVFIARTATERAGPRPSGKPRYVLIARMDYHPQATKYKWRQKSGKRAGRQRTEARMPMHRLVVEADMNGLAYDAYIARLQTGDVQGLVFLDPAVHVHHKDRNPKNNARENLEVLTAEEHLTEHADADWWRHVTIDTAPDTITAIEYVGEEPTYDLTMLDPHNNYVANGIVVHNSGKTWALTAWGLYCPRLPVVVVTKAAARGQWKKQVTIFTHVRPWVAYPSTSKEAKKQAPLEEYMASCLSLGERPFIILSWTSLHTWAERVAALCQQQFGGFSVGFDESHMGKAAKRVKATLEKDGTTSFEQLGNLSAVAANLSGWATRRLCTTATPVKDRFRDLWAQADLAEPGCYGGFSKFSKRYCDARPGAFGGMDTTGTSNMDEFLKRISFVVHRATFRETHGDLPPKRRQSVYIPPEEQSKGWSTSKYNAEMKRAAAKGPSAIMEVRLAYAASLKRDVIVDYVIDALQQGQKVLVLCIRTENVDALYAAITKACAKIFAGKNPPTLLAGYGSGEGPHQTTPEAREKMRQAYWDSQGATCLVGTGDAWGTAYDLHDTDLAIFESRPWTGGDFHQWEQRVSRRGQRRPVLILFPVAEGTVDEHVIGRLIDKLPAMEQVAGDTETASAHAALTGTEDRERMAAQILAELDAINFDAVED